MSKVTILGAGSWGTALAQISAQSGNQVTLWHHEPTRLEEIQKKHRNSKYHPGVELHDLLLTEPKIAKAVAAAEFILLCTPSNSLSELLTEIKPHMSKNAILVNTAKGLDSESSEGLFHVAQEVLGKDRAKKSYSVLSGPSFAYEVIRNMPTAVTVASFSNETAQKVQEALHTPTFRIYTSDDVTGVEISGALKNVIAIVTGVADGLGFGNNARAGLLTRALGEIARIGTALGAHPLTFSGLSGMGDLILTCTSDLSRNRRVGLLMAKGKTLKQIMREVGQVAEGIRTAKNVHMLAKKLNLDVPIFEETYLALFRGKAPEQAIRDLLSRAPESERH